MNKRNILFGMALGFTIGYVLRHQLETTSNFPPEQALQLAKEKFEKEGPIVGSWIYVNKERLEKNGLTYETYRGGISRQIDDKTVQIEFHLDAETGAVIQASELTS